jgi:arginase family enzyme
LLPASHQSRSRSGPSGGSDEPVFVTVDTDVFDPPTPEMGFEGLQPVQVSDRLSQVFRANEICGFDVVETATDELGSATANLAAQTLVRGSAVRG